MSSDRTSNQPRAARTHPGEPRRASPGFRYLFITITLLAAPHRHVHAQQITTQAPPLNSGTAPPQNDLPDLPDAAQFPTARVLPPPPPDLSPILESDTQTYRDHLFTLTGNVVVTYGTRRVQADRITYNSDSGDIEATGHLILTDSRNAERILASAGTYNLQTTTGRFTDVTGSVGVKLAPVNTRRVVYTTANPFLFTGGLLIKTGPQTYDIYDGTVTSCQLPHPDWLLSSGHFSVKEGKARGYNSVFHLVSIPVFYLPYVTAPTGAGERQSGFVIPTLSTFDKNGTSGVRVGEQYYLVLGRSADLTIGAEDYTSIGYAQNVTFRLKGHGLDFANVHYDGLLDRRTGTANQGGEEFTLAGRHDFTPNTRAAANIDYLSSYIYREAFTDTFNQAVTSDLVSTAYLARAHNGFELSGLADRYQGIKTIAQTPTPAAPLGIPQSQVRIFHAPTIAFNTTDHLIPGTATRFSNGLEYELESAAAGLKRSQPTFVTGGIIERLDLHPQLSYPLFLGKAGSAWHLLPLVAARETLYTRSRAPSQPGKPPMESLAGLARSDFEFAFSVRPPVIERTFTPPEHLQKYFGTALRHTIEPELTYRLTTGVGGAQFPKVLRFDATDVVSNTNEAEYGVTQRLFRRVAHPGPCLTDVYAAQPGFSSNAADDPSAPPGKDAPPGSGTTGGDTDATLIQAGEGQLAESAQETSVGSGGVSPLNPRPTKRGFSPGAPCSKSEALISWRLTQKYFFDPTFGGAIVNSRRNIFETTLNLSGVAFLTEPRNISPLVSRLRVRTSAHTDVEWDFDLDTGARKFTSSNVYLDLHQGQYFSALSYARLDAPGRFFTQDPDPTTAAATTGVSSAVSDFNQLRFLIGYGNPAKPGLSLAANTGLDLKSLYGTTSASATVAGINTTTTVYPPLLQYASVQSSYNFNCCGFSVEYRKFELGSVRNEGSYKFSFTLANIGTAGNLRRAERLF